MKSFDELTLSPPLAQSIKEMGYSIPTPIQAATLPILMGAPTDFSGMASTGTGKTAAFGIPLLERIDLKNRAVQGVVLCPTRELAVQVAEQITLLGKHKKVHALAIYGGTGFSEQLRGIRRGAYIIVATPGRLVDHINQGNIVLDSVNTFVLDEADEMISMGFKDDLEFLLQQFSKERCNRWLFAATMSPALKSVADTYLRKPKTARVNQAATVPGTVKQIYYTVREKNKPKGLCKLIDMSEDFYGLIFCQTKVLVIGLTEYLRSKGYKVDCLHGDKNQFERESALLAFKQKAVNIIVCSDVAARGLDVKDLTHVINYSLPHDFDSYVHRIGRTGRSGSTGIAISLVSPAQMHMIDRLERVTRSVIEPGVFPSRRDVSAKKLVRLLPKFTQAPAEKAQLILSDEWKSAIDGMSKEEIAARFLSMYQPELFDDVEMAEGVAIRGATDDERSNEGRGNNRRHSRPFRRQRGNDAPSGGRPSFRGKGFHRDRNDAPRH